MAASTRHSPASGRTLRLLLEGVLESQWLAPCMMVWVRFKVDGLVVARAEGAFALAREQVADLAEAHVAVHLGILAARDVEAIAGGALLDHVEFERAAARPGLLAVDE